MLYSSNPESHFLLYTPTDSMLSYFEVIIYNPSWFRCVCKGFWCIYITYNCETSTKSMFLNIHECSRGICIQNMELNNKIFKGCHIHPIRLICLQPLSNMDYMNLYGQYFPPPPYCCRINFEFLARSQIIRSKTKKRDYIQNVSWPDRNKLNWLFLKLEFMDF